MMRTATLLLAGGLLAVGACDPGTSSSTTTQPVEDFVELPKDPPRYTFADGLADSKPELVRFVRHFLETCLAGDYAGYRRLVSRRVAPESRSRFQRVLHALRNLHIVTIEEIALEELPTETYLVIGEGELEYPQRAGRQREDEERRLSILVLREEGEWRMMIAPPGLQPKKTVPPTTTAPTTTTAPSYPWDEDGDY